MALLTREEILSAQDLRHEDIDVPEWGGTVRVRSLKSGELYELGKSSSDGVDFRAQIIAACVVNEDGSRAFTMEDITKLAEKNAAVMDAVYDVAARLNALTRKQAEQLEKN